MSDNKNLWQSWLNSEKCIPVLRKCVKSMKRMFLEDMKINESSFENALEELTTEFWIYLSTRGEKLEAELSKFIYLKDLDKLKRKLTSMFYYYLKEQKRDTYYRHIRQVLTEYEECSCCTQKGYTVYAFTESKNLSSFENDFQSLPLYPYWPHPEIPAQEINTKNGIIKVARFFWEQVKDRLGYECFVPVRELIRYLHSQYNLREIYNSLIFESELSSSSNIKDEQDRTSEDILGYLAQYNPSTYSQSSKKEVYSNAWLKELAQKLVNRLTEEQFKIFCLRYFGELNMKTMASKLGYNRESNVAYHLNKVHTKIKEFCSMWPGLSPPDYEESLFLDFFEQIGLLCHELQRI